MNAFKAIYFGKIIFLSIFGGINLFVSSITTERIITGLNQPIYATATASRPSELFILDRTGKIEILNLLTRRINPDPFLTISGSDGYLYIANGDGGGGNDIGPGHTSGTGNAQDLKPVGMINLLLQILLSSRQTGWKGKSKSKTANQNSKRTIRSWSILIHVVNRPVSLDGYCVKEF